MSGETPPAGRRLPVVASGELPAAPPLFDRIGIVGLGLIGGSLALACRAAWPGSLVIGVDRNDVMEAAIVRHAVDVGADDLGMLAEAQLVVLAAPVRANIDVLRKLPEYVRGEAIVTDVGSTKQAIVDAARALPERLAFVGGHPLAGAARSGIEAGAAGMFRGRPRFLTPGSVDSTAVQRVSAFVQAIGAEPHEMAPDEHDRLMAALSHVPQLVGSALMAVVGPQAGEAGLALAGRGLRDTTRLASSPSSVWADVCATNTAEIGPLLDVLIGTLAKLRADLDAGNRLAEVFDAAQQWRAALERSAR